MATFNKSFAAARRAGRKTFTWQGKSYTTELAGSNNRTTSAPTPRSRPSTANTPTPRARPTRNVRTFGPGARSLINREKGRKGPSTSPVSHHPRNTMGKRRKSEARLRKG